MSSTADLTPREMQVLTLVLGGLGNKQIAAELGITEQAIKEHVKFKATARVLREVDGNVRGAVLVLTDPY